MLSLARILETRPAISSIKLRRHRCLDFVNLFEVCADGVEHWFDFIDIADTMTCQINGTVLVIRRLEFPAIRPGRPTRLPIIQSNRVLDKQDDFAFSKCRSTCRGLFNIPPSVHFDYWTVGAVCSSDNYLQQLRRALLK